MLAKGCLACRRQNNAICKLPARAPHPANGVRTEQLGAKMANPDVQSMGRARFARPHLPNSKSEQTNGKIALYENQRSHEKDLPCKIQSLPSSRTHTIYHVQFQEVKGLPSNVPASYHWKPPASTLAHCLAVIHPKQDVLAKGCLACRRQSHLQTPSTSPTPGQRCAD